MTTKESYPVTFFEVMGQDAARLGEFYAKAFGWKVAEPTQTMEYRMVAPSAANGIPGGIGKAPHGPGWVTFYVNVPDPAASLAEVEQLGGKTVMAAFEIPSGLTIAYFADPEGHVVGLVKRPEVQK